MLVLENNKTQDLGVYINVDINATNKNRDTAVSRVVIWINLIMHKSHGWNHDRHY